MLGYVYLMVEIDEGGNEKYKIGITKNNPEQRLKKLRTGNSNQLDLIRIYKSENYKRIERFLHRKYSSQKTIANNEFFSLNVDQVLNFIDSCREAEDIIESLRDNPFYR